MATGISPGHQPRGFSVAQEQIAIPFLVWTRHCAKCCDYIFSGDSHDHPVKPILLATLYRYENWSLEGLSDSIPRTTMLVSKHQSGFEPSLWTSIPRPFQLLLSCYPWIVTYVGINSFNKYLLRHCSPSKYNLEMCLRRRTYCSKAQTTQEGGWRTVGMGNDW